MTEQKPDTACRNQNRRTFQNVGNGKDKPAILLHLFRPVYGIFSFRIRDNMHLEIRCGCDQFFRQRRLTENAFPCGRASSDHNFRYAGKPCKFGDLIRDIFTVYRLDFCAELFGKTHIASQPLEIFFVHCLKIGCLDKKSRKGTAESVGHACGSTDNFRIIRRR